MSITTVRLQELAQQAADSQPLVDEIAGLFAQVLT